MGKDSVIDRLRGQTTVIIVRVAAGKLQIPVGTGGYAVVGHAVEVVNERLAIEVSFRSIKLSLYTIDGNSE